MANYAKTVSLGVALAMSQALQCEAIVPSASACKTAVTANNISSERQVTAKDGLSLSLSLLEDRVSVSSKIMATMRLAVTNGTPVDILSNLPSGSYDVQVTNQVDGEREPDRVGYLTQISQIGLDHISPGCPDVKTLDLSARYQLRPGKYTVRAYRRPARVISWEPYKTERFATVISNEVTLDVDP